MRLAKHKVHVFLFGSRANGEAGEASDVDVALLPLTVFPRGC